MWQTEQFFLPINVPKNENWFLKASVLPDLVKPGDLSLKYMYVHPHICMLIRMLWKAK